MQDIEQAEENEIGRTDPMIHEVEGGYSDSVDVGKKARRKKPKEGFLSKVDLEGLKRELGMSAVEEIGAFVNLANPKGAYNWAKDQDDHGTRPSYNAVVRMLQRGASTKTLFGVEQHPIGGVKEIPPYLKKIMNHPEFIAGLDAAYKAESGKK